MRTILHVVDIDASPDAVYEAIATAKGLAGWWTTQVSADERVGGIVGSCSSRASTPTWRSPPLRIKVTLTSDGEATK
jgi:uncharacterized protein YndB with AHSA1/START domain